MAPTSFIFFLLATIVSAHSWVEQMQLISSNGSYTGDLGYPRGYVARTDPKFNGYSDKWQLPSPETELGRIRVNSSDYLCHPAQRTANYTSQYPKLKMSPDSYIAMRYLENGHVTQPWIPAGKPAGSGTVFVYGTYDPSDAEKIVDVLQWTTDGKGGNGKGFLMTAQNFDDGRCHQPNVSPISVNRQMVDADELLGQESWCETDLHVPADVKAGSTLTLYWIWSWQTSVATEGAPCGKDEYYTTCADIDIAGSSFNVKALLVAPVVHTLVQQDPRASAVSDYKSRTAFETTPNLVTTEACSITSVTSSPLPASMTQPTSLPAGFLESMKQLINNKSAPPPPATSAEPFPSSAAVPSSSSTALAVPGSSVVNAPVMSIMTVTVTYTPPTTSTQPVPTTKQSSSSSSVTTSSALTSSVSTSSASTTSKTSSSSQSTTKITSTSTLSLTSTTTATTLLPAFTFSPSSSAVSDHNGMLGQGNDQGMIGQRRRRGRGVLFVG